MTKNNRGNRDNRNKRKTYGQQVAVNPKIETTRRKATTYII